MTAGGRLIMRYNNLRIVYKGVWYEVKHGKGDYDYMAWLSKKGLHISYHLFKTFREMVLSMHGKETCCLEVAGIKISSKSRYYCGVIFEDYCEYFLTFGEFMKLLSELEDAEDGKHDILFHNKLSYSI